MLRVGPDVAGRLLMLRVGPAVAGRPDTSHGVQKSALILNLNTCYLGEDDGTFLLRAGSHWSESQRGLRSLCSV